MTTTTALLDEISGYFGADRAPALFTGMAARPDYLRTSWDRYRTTLETGEIDRTTKELMGLGVAATKSSAYVIGLQRRRLRAADIGPAGELEALAVVDFFEGFDAFAHALHVDSELRPRLLQAGDMSLIDREIDVNVPYVLEPDDPSAREVYAEIKSAMHIPFVPNIFKALAHQPAMLKAKWEAYKAIMARGELRRLTKELIAVAVSAVNACFY